MAKDIVIQEINKFFIAQGFEELLINNRTVFKSKDGGYYLISKSGKSSYYLEDAQTLEEAENCLYEDMAAYQISLGINSLIDEIKNDIKKYILKNKANITSDAETTIFRYAN